MLQQDLEKLKELIQEAKDKLEQAIGMLECNYADKGNEQSYYNAQILRQAKDGIDGVADDVDKQIIIECTNCLGRNGVNGECDGCKKPLCVDCNNDLNEQDKKNDLPEQDGYCWDCREKSVGLLKKIEQSLAQDDDK